MMHYAINYDGGYITGVVAGVSAANSNCTEAEYRETKAMLLNPPDAADGFYYRLREDLEWELTEAPEISGEISDAEALAIILGEVSV